MRPIHIAQLDKPRPVLVLTREAVRPYLTRVTAAPITSTIRGLDRSPGRTPQRLDRKSVVSCDNIVTSPAGTLGRQVGYLLLSREPELAEAIQAAFDLA